jgi:hypothetical protein
MTWGCSALLIRECVRRWRKVNLVEILFPERREELWLRTRGFVVASVVFVLGAIVAWYGWTQRARVTVFHMPPYSPPPLYLCIGLAAILLLVLGAYLLPFRRSKERGVDSHSVPEAWLVGLIICTLATPWTTFVLLGYGYLPTLPFASVLALGLLWAAITFFLVQRSTSNANWSDAHRFAALSGGVQACMLGGFVVFKVGGALRRALRSDWIGKAVLNLIAVAGLMSVRRSVGRNV